jgi:hypothetical protein
MHILFLTDNFPPETNAPATRTYEHTREWVKAGHNVTVITCAPNFPKGQVFAGYRNRLWQRETIDGIQVIRVWSFITANEGFLKRTLDYMSFMVTGFLASLFVRKVDVVIGTSPQFFTVCAAYVTSLFKRVPWVFELRDLWPESIRAVGAMGDSKILDRLESLELFLYGKADRIVTVTESFKRNLIGRGVEAKKISVVTNGVDISKFSPRPKDDELVQQYGLQGKFVAGYIGTHGLAHALETLLDAAEIVQAMPQGDRFRFVLLGEGANKASLKQSAIERGLNNVLFIDSVSKQEIARYWSLLDTAIIHLKRTELFTTVIPSKLFECMAMGIPVLHGVQGESAEIVEREGVGLLFEPENAKALAQELLILAREPDVHRQIQTQGPLAAMKFCRKELALSMIYLIDQTTVDR